jgi:type II secretory pathway pseudopilin PulG
MKITKAVSKFRRESAFTLMEILVVIAIIIVIAAIALPVFGKMRSKANKAHALGIMKNLASAAATYAGAHDGQLPDEDGQGKEDWTAIATPDQAKAWYNALPRQMGSKAVADFVTEGRTAAFYTKENILFLPGASYPESKKQQKPLFAIAINGKLQQKDQDGKKNDVRLQNVASASNVVLFLEQGLPGEVAKDTHPTIKKSDYDGAPKGNAKSFVARYTEKGIISFLDGSAREVSGKDLLTQTGDIIWNPGDESQIRWTVDPKKDPNGKGGKGTGTPTK